MRKKRKKGSTDLLNQYEDFCTKCRHKSKSVCKKGQLWCALYDEFMDIDKLKEAPVFCNKKRR